MHSAMAARGCDVLDSAKGSLSRGGPTASAAAPNSCPRRDHAVFVGVGHGDHHPRLKLCTFICTMVLLWLADIVCRSERATNHRGAKRQRLTLPESTWLSDKLAAGRWSGRMDTRENHILVRGLLDVQHGTEWRGLLTRWSKEAMTMREYYQNPADGYTGLIRNAFALSSPQPLHHVQDHLGFVRVAKVKHPILRPHGFAHADRGESNGARLVIDGDSVAQLPCTVSQAIGHWGFGAADLDSAMVIVMVKPLADLVLQRRWHTIFMRASWGLRPFIGYPDHDWADANHGQFDVQPAAEVGGELTYAKVDALMENLRRWAPVILASGEAEDAMDEQVSLEMSLH